MSRGRSSGELSAFRPIAAAVALLEHRALTARQPARQNWTDLELLILRRHLRPDTIESLRVMCVACASIPAASRGSLTPREEAVLAEGAAALVTAAQCMSAALRDRCAGPALDDLALSLLSDWARGTALRFAPDRSPKSRGGRRRELDLAQALVKVVAYRVKDYRIRPAAGESRFMQVMRPAFALAGLCCSERAVRAYIRSMRDRPDRAAFAYWNMTKPLEKEAGFVSSKSARAIGLSAPTPPEQSMPTHAKPALRLVANR